MDARVLLRTRAVVETRAIVGVDYVWRRLRREPGRRRNHRPLRLPPAPPRFVESSQAVAAVAETELIGCPVPAPFASRSLVR
jgi:hypothetical protein